MQIWHMEPYPIGDRRMPHHVFPPKILSTDQLLQVSGVVHFKVDLDDKAATKKRFSRIRTDRHLVPGDVTALDENVTDLVAKLDAYYEPVEKDTESVFLVLEGDAYYDVLYDDDDDNWIRMHLSRGDLIIIPKGRSYRFTVTPKNFVKVQRFTEENV